MFASKSFRRLCTAAVIAIVATLIAWGASKLKSVQDLEDESIDVRMLAFPPHTEPSLDIVMIWLDEPTMRALPYRSPIPRDFLARLHQRIVAAKPWLIGYDIFFKDPSFERDDHELAKALEGSVTYAVMPRRGDGTVDMPLPLFRDELAGVGLSDLPFNPFDATVRRAKLSFETDQGTMPSFAALLFEAATGVNAGTAIEERVQAPGFGPFRTTPFVRGTDELVIRFAGPPGRVGSKENAFRIFSAALVEKGLIPASWLANKIVLVGASYEDLKDAFLTPYFAKATQFSRMNGVEITANVLSSLLTGQYLFLLAPWQIWCVTFIIALLIALITTRLSVWWYAPLFMVVIALMILLAIVLFQTAGVIFPLVAPCIGAVGAFGVGLAFRALTEGRQKRFIKGVFARYVPPAVVERMTENPALLKLGGETREVTSLFSDIASFTTISERMDPATLVAFLNDYLGRMNEVLFAYGATLDKYEGDAIIAFFNAPLDVPEHEQKAARAALAMRRVGTEITKVWGERCGREIVTRIGMHSGPAVVGNMGSEGRFDYTAIGDTINLASRLEGANKFYGTTLMVSEATALKLPSTIIVRPLERVRVKGKRVPILLFELMDDEEGLNRDLLSELITPYREAFDLIEKQSIEEARRLIDDLLGRFPDDGPLANLKRLCERAHKEPAWDLVTELTAK